MKIKVLLTGASGEVGFEAFQEIIKRNDCYDLTILSLDNKSERRKFKPYSHAAKIVWGDIRDPDIVIRAVSGADVVIHVAALIPPAADQYPKLADEINVGGTRNLVDAMIQQKPSPRLIYTSSIAVYGDRIENPEISVGDPLTPSVGDEYAITKIKAENIIRYSGLDWTIFRLCGVLCDRLKVQPLMFHMPLNTSLEFCHSSDVGYALVEAIECKPLRGKIFNLGGGESCRIIARDFLNRMLPIYGISPGLIPEYAFAVKNFHSGYYSDNDVLESYLGFQRKGLQEYFYDIQGKVSAFQKLFLRMVPKFLIRNWILRLSEPLKAVKENDHSSIKRFYGSIETFQELFSGTVQPARA
jgi:cholest-5-ene-3beta,7alpha-diol 3beta-dehydrogenase